MRSEFLHKNNLTWKVWITKFKACTGRRSGVPSTTKDSQILLPISLQAFKNYPWKKHLQLHKFCKTGYLAFTPKKKALIPPPRNSTEYHHRWLFLRTKVPSKEVFLPLVRAFKKFDFHLWTRKPLHRFQLTTIITRKGNCPNSTPHSALLRRTSCSRLLQGKKSREMRT